MTNPPYATGPASEPNPQQSGAGSPSFQYRPHDPYGAFTPGQPTGPVLPPAPTFWQRWGVLPMEGRLKQVTWILQLLWIYLAAAVLLMLISLGFSAVMAGFLGSGAGLVLNLVFGVLVAAATLVLIWAVARERLGRFGLENPRTVFYIGLGFLGLVALFGLIGALKVPFALVQILAVLGVLGLIFTKPVGAWLRDTPGNQSAKAAEQRPAAADDHVFPGYQPPPPQWRDAAVPPTAGPPVSPPPAPGPVAPPPATGAYRPPLQPPPSHGPTAPQGWPQPPQ
ncbi:hypothetical protein [Glycomyces algeriensis]|uniref:Uncharacterized protein n=1 Tax=Glycomyces algeriensis TaxID=256037 RepID=A0A9W6GD31_9ACTN|nr:hypothetical protein [Glycomyces algeriensis]MDA1366420.1 hypothetical protein [Glycomyces algeriensis]MDR7352079.1 multisubunit Na+/H+ antiporter MnhB subunit [Glycomyces algeriensis]GLI44811.1 hypothetical protein GALLR39Z86_46610 [Glycomyces algeriensis]